MKFIGILLLLVAVVAIEASTQGAGISQELEARAAYPCKVDNDCPQGYGCKCEEYHKVCVFCQECTTDEYCRDKYNTSETSCKCPAKLCVGCIQSP